MTHSMTNRFSPLQTTIKLAMLVAVGFLAMPSQAFASLCKPLQAFAEDNDDQPEINSASEPLQDCLLTPGNTTSFGDGTVNCHVGGKTTSCDLDSPEADDQCTTTKNRGANGDKCHAESAAGAIVVQENWPHRLWIMVGLLFQSTSAIDCPYSIQAIREFSFSNLSTK